MPKRILQGVCVSDKQDKTVVVQVERRYTHPLLKKTVRSRKKYYAHDESNAVKAGDIVRIDVEVASFALTFDGRPAELVYADRMEFHKGDVTLAPGIEFILVGGHAPAAGAP